MIICMGWVETIWRSVALIICYFDSALILDYQTKTWSGTGWTFSNQTRLSHSSWSSRKSPGNGKKNNVSQISSKADHLLLIVLQPCCCTGLRGIGIAGSHLLIDIAPTPPVPTQPLRPLSQGQTDRVRLSIFRLGHPLPYGVGGGSGHVSETHRHPIQSYPPK